MTETGVGQAEETGEGAPLLSVCVVLFHTDPALVESCLGSIAAAAPGLPGRVEIVVVDNSSDRGLQAQFADRVDTWVESPSNLGFGAASNIAIRAGTGRFAFFLNPDADLAPHALAALVDAAEDSAATPALFCGWLQRDGSPQVDAFMNWWFSTGRLLRRRSYRRYLVQGSSAAVLPVQKVSGGALFGSRALLLELGPFDTRFFLYGEDADLSERARKKGIRLLAVPAALVRHVGASSQSTFSTLVERARTDATVRLTSYHLPRIVSLAARLDLLVITVIGLVPGLGRSSANKKARSARLLELRRWGLAREMPPFQPPGRG